MEIPIIRKKNITIFKETKYQFVIFIVFSIYCFFTGLLINPYTNVTKQLMIAYKITIPQILGTMIMFLVGKILMSPFAGIILKVAGLKIGLYLSFCLMLFACYFRTFMESHFNILLFGQFVGGTSAALIVSSQMKILYEWFHPKNRGVFCTFLSLAFNLGGMIGIIYISLFVNSQEMDIDKIKTSIQLFDKINLFFVFMLILVHALLFSSKPKEGYGFIEIDGRTIIEDQEVIKSEEDVDIEIDVRLMIAKLFSNIQFTKFLVVYVFFNSIILLIISSMNIIFEEFGVKGNHKEYILTLIFVFGIIGSVKFNRSYLNRPDCHKIFFNFLIIGLSIYILSCVLLLLKCPVWVFYVVYPNFGYFFFFGMPASVEFLIREANGVPLTFVNGIIYFAAQSTACFLLLINQCFYKFWGDRIDAASICGMILVGSLNIPIILALKLN